MRYVQFIHMSSVYVHTHLSMYIHIAPDVHISSTMRWLWLVGSIKFQVSFAKEPYKRDDILQKRPIFLIDPTDRSHPICDSR